MIKIIVLRNSEGFTLVEVLVSMVIMAIIFLGLLQSITIYIRENLANSMRDEAVKIAQECAESLRNLEKCTNSSSGDTTITDTISRNFRSFTQNFTITYSNPNKFSSGTNNATIIVNYEYPQGKNHTYQLQTVVYKK